MIKSLLNNNDSFIFINYEILLHVLINYYQSDRLLIYEELSDVSL